MNATNGHIGIFYEAVTGRVGIDMGITITYTTPFDIADIKCGLYKSYEGGAM